MTQANNEYYHRHRIELLKRYSKELICKTCKVKYKWYNQASHKKSYRHKYAKNIIDEIKKLKISNTE